ncbi:aldose epimerase family protein [Roseibacillus persicicus]|uniref:Aldose 1-epimerase n=1 Tax=Roseibacillus persicicus TaxID=454148 RepID=A0A918TBF1_9BACT|nr:aldose epimerase family protein [Roseibacillus persicicus]MDQ8190673.1 galactose mutarotase [Roseibacillus persicicus]GHC41015.1 aldose 1-epimerase [Roseibacillus persicicus]
MEIYGKLSDGREVKIFTLQNKNGMIAKVSEFGAILTNLMVPDRNGQVQDLTHGYDDLAGWESNNSYFGSTVGRFGNRIANGKFTLDGETYQLATNNDPGGLPCHLHGGLAGFDKVLWKGELNGQEVKLTYVSKDGEEGYPGELTVTITYSLNDDNELTWSAEATTNRATPVNIVHHSYWNLSGDPTTSINDHLLTLNADRYLPTNAGLIPTGEIRSVDETPMDFREPTEIGVRVETPYECLLFGGGYDHAWVLNEDGMRLAAKVEDPKTGRTLELFTDQPAVQFYGGNFLDGQTAGKNGLKYEKRTGLCLETELFPDGPNQPSFPNCILRPGETYRHTMIHRFGW